MPAINKVEAEGLSNNVAGENLNITTNIHNYAAPVLPEPVPIILEQVVEKRRNNLEDPPPHFTGRGREREAVRVALQKGHTALYATPGVGKSTLALQIAHDALFDFDIVWWVNAQSGATANQDLGKLAELFQTFHDSENVQVRLAALKQHLQDAGKNCLIILDNVENKQQFEADYKQLLGKARVLFTSREGTFSHFGTQIELKQWEKHDASAYLLARLDKETNENDRLDLAERLGCLPLTLHHAACYIEFLGCGIMGYLSRLEKQGVSQILNKSAKQAGGTSLPEIIALSRAHLKETLPVADVLLQLLSLLAEDKIPQELFAKIDSEDPAFSEIAHLSNDDVRDVAFALLKNLGLISSSNSEIANLPKEWKATVSLHRSTREIVAAEAEDFAPACLQHLLYKATFINSSHNKHWGIYESLLKHLEHELPKPFDKASVDEKGFFYSHLANYYEIAEGNLPKALTVWKQLVEFDKNNFVPEREKADSFYALATCFDKLGQHLPANINYEKCLKISETVLDAKDPALMWVYANYALSLLSSERPNKTKAKELHDKAFEIYEGLENKDEYVNMLSLNAVYFNLLKNFKAAIEYQLQLVRINEKRLAAGEIDHFEMGKTYNNLSVSFGNLGEWREALVYAEKALDCAKILPETHSSRIRWQKHYAFAKKQASKRG